MHKRHISSIAFTSLFFASIFPHGFCYGKAKKETCPGAHRQKLPPSMTSRHADSDGPEPCSTASICLAADPVSGAPGGPAWWPTGAWLQPYSPSTLGCLQSLSEKSPPQSGHLSSPLLSSFCCFSLSFTHLDSVGARLFPPSPFGNSRLPSSHIIPGAGGPTKCHASRVAPRLAFDVMFSGVTAPAGLVEQPDEHRGGKEGGGHPTAPQAVLCTGTRRSPPFALQDTTEPWSRFVSDKGRASLSCSMPLGCHSRDLLLHPPTTGWRVSSWYCYREKTVCQCLLISHAHEEHLYVCIHHSHPHPSPHEYMGISSRRDQGPSIQDYATEGGNAWECVG